MKSKAFTSGKVAKMLGIPARTVRRYILSGRIPAEQNPLTKRWRVPQESLSVFMSRYQLEPPPLSLRGQALVLSRRAEVIESVAAVLGQLAPELILEKADDPFRALVLLGRLQPHLVIVDLSIAESWPAMKVLSEDCAGRNARLVLVAGEAGFPDLNGAPIHRFEAGSLKIGLETLIQESLADERAKTELT